MMAKDEDLVNRTMILQLACEFRIKNSDEPWSERRQKTLENLLLAVNEKRKKERNDIETEERQKFASRELVTLESIQNIIEEEKRTKEEIARFFEGTVQDIAKHTRLGVIVEKNLREKGVLKQVAELPDFRSKTYKLAKKETEEEARKAVKEVILHQQLEITRERIKDFKKKRVYSEKEIAERKFQEKREALKTSKAFEPKFVSAKSQRDIVRARFISSKKVNGVVDASAASIANKASIGTSSRPNHASSSGLKSEESKRDGLNGDDSSKYTSSRRDLGSSRDGRGSSLNQDFATRFYKNQRCLFNSAQMDAVEKLYKNLVKDQKESDSSKRKGETPTGGVGEEEDEGEPSEEAEGGHAARIALQQKGFVARKVMSFSQFQRALRKGFRSEEDVGLMKRIYSVMCGRDSATKKEGLNFSKFSVFVSILLLGGFMQKLFLFFEILDTDRDGFITKHDIFSLLRSDADCAVSHDFSVLLGWVLEVSERRQEREKKWQVRMEKKHRLIQRALEQREKEKKREAGEIPDYEEESDSESIDSYSSATDWVLNDPDAEAEEYKAMTELSEMESRMDFEKFRHLWHKSDPPQFFVQFAACFSSINMTKEMIWRKSMDKSAKGSRLEVDGSNGGVYSSKKGGAGDLFSQSIALTKAKHGLLNTLRARTKLKLESGKLQVLQLSKKTKGSGVVEEENDDVDVDSRTEDSESHPVEKRALLASMKMKSNKQSKAQLRSPNEEKSEPGRFLRDLDLSVDDAKQCRVWFEKMHPHTFRGTVSKSRFCDILIKANVGFEKRPSLRFLCERIFLSACDSSQSEMTFSNFLVLYATCHHGSRREQSKLVFKILNETGAPVLYANDLVKVVESGIEDIDPILAGYLTDLVIDKLTRSEQGSISKEDMILLAEYIRNEKDAHTRAVEAEIERDRYIALQETKRGSIHLTPSRPHSRSNRNSSSRGVGADEDQESTSSFSSFRSRRLKVRRGSTFRSRRKDTDGEESMSSKATSVDLVAHERKMSAASKGSLNNVLRDKLVAEKMQSLELPSVRKRVEQLEENAGVEFVILYKVAHAFGRNCTI